MIGALEGTVTATQGQTIVVMVNGIGYEVAVPSVNSLPVGESVFLYTYLAVRETALNLYGFASQSDKEFFELLLSVPKIGPKSALQVMTQAQLQLLVECIQTEDPGRLQKMSGLGKKTCENIVTNLHNKIDNVSVTTTHANSNNLTETQADAVDALITLGFDPKTAHEKVLQQSSQSLSVSELVAAALK